MTWIVDKKLLLMKIHYALLNAGVAPMVNFGPVIAKQVGLSALTTGCMYTVLPVIGLFLKLILSGIADKYKLRRLMLSLAVLVSIISSLCMISLSTSSTGQNVSILCHDRTFFSSCRNHGDAPDPEKMWKDLHGTVECEIQCTQTPDLVKEITSTWNETLCCINHKQKITFSAFVKKAHLFSLLNCLYGNVQEVKLKDSSKSVIPVCRKDINVSCTMKCANFELSTALRTDESSFANDLKKPHIWMLLIVYVISMSGFMLSNSLSDAICFGLLGDEPDKFGIQRMFGAVAFGFSTWFSGWLIDWFSHDAFSKNYEPIFYMSSIVLLLDLFVILRLKIDQKVSSASVVNDVWVLMYSAKIWIFGVWCLLSGLYAGITWQFLYWHLEDISTAEDLQWSKTLQGSANIINTVVGELPCFFISGWIIKKIGHINTMSLVLFSLALRFFCYSILVHPWWVLPVELISGFGFSLTYVIMASYSSLIALPGTESTIQALFSAIFDGLGISCAGVIGGLIYYRHNGYVLYSLMSYSALIATILHVLIQWKVKSNPVQTSHQGRSSSAVYSSPTEAITMLSSNS